MACFEMIKYHGRVYPPEIPLRIEEIAANFDTKQVTGELEWSLHTEYSYGKRVFSTEIVSHYPEIIAAQKNGIPQLWKNEEWASEFADFLTELSEGHAPAVIEIHPPFKDYTDFGGFATAYQVFEQKISAAYPNVQILIENRCGSIYRGGRFLISKVSDIASLCEAIEKYNLALRIAYDIPQVYTAHNAKKTEQYTDLLEQTKSFAGYIGGVHLWGKRKSPSGRKVSHCGDLNSYFSDAGVKEAFLQAFMQCFDDDIVRKLVLEVNSGNEDLLSIVSDLMNCGVSFV